MAAHAVATSLEMGQFHGKEPHIHQGAPGLVEVSSPQTLTSHPAAAGILLTTYLQIRIFSVPFASNLCF